MGGNSRRIQQKVVLGCHESDRDIQGELTMKQQIRVIKTQREYDDAIARLSVLMDDDIKTGSSKEAELELLALVIEAFERNKVAPVTPDPIAAIQFRMDQMGLSKKDMAPYFGSLPKASEVLSRKRPLSLSMIRQIHKGLGISADILLSETDYEVNLDDEPQYDYKKFPWQEMIDRGYMKRITDCGRHAKEHVEEFFKTWAQDMLPSSRNHAFLRAPIHQNGARIMDEYALLVWRIAVLKKARQRKPFLKVAYKDNSITEEWLRDLVKLSRFDQGPLLAVQHLADIGIALVIEEHFKKTYLDGAAMLDGNSPVVALTLRHDRIDNFWFALLHELIHVQKHLKPEHSFIADNLDDKTRTSLEEQEADQGAEEALIPEFIWATSEVCINPTTANTHALADQLRIHPAIVAGRVRHQSKNWRLLKGIVGSVKYLFEEQQHEA